jgi:hypothetical protein
VIVDSIKVGASALRPLMGRSRENWFSSYRWLEAEFFVKLKLEAGSV